MVNQFRGPATGRNTLALKPGSVNPLAERRLVSV